MREDNWIAARTETTPLQGGATTHVGQGVSPVRGSTARTLSERARMVAVGLGGSPRRANRRAFVSTFESVTSSGVVAAISYPLRSVAGGAVVALGPRSGPDCQDCRTPRLATPPHTSP